MKKVFGFILSLTICVQCFGAVSAMQSADTIVVDVVSPDVKKEVSPLDKKDWTVCIYMCGTDLESESSAATADLLEMLSADIPDDVNILVMTGGTKTWNPFEFDKDAIEENAIKEGAYLTPDSEHTQIYTIDDDKMSLVYTYDDNLDMGDVCTLEKFLEFALYYAPAEHLMISLWNHGGGPMSGVEYDENTDNFISVPEYTAFTEALYKARGKKVDILGFDACLIGNLEIALNIAPYADYMLASAEVEPGDGWDYEWMSVFSEANEEGRTVEPTEVGQSIIDTYPSNEGYDWANTNGLTLALYDLSKADELRVAFDNMAVELTKSLDDSDLFSQISRRAEKVSSMYAGTNGLLDLYDFAYDMSDLLPSAKQIIDVLGEIPEGDNIYSGRPLGDDPFIVYRGVSPDYKECIGITFFYPVSKTRIPDEVQAGKMANVYSNLKMTDAYSNFIYELLLRTDKIQHFKGEITLKYDYDRDEVVIAVENPEDTIALSKVDYSLIYTKTHEDGTKTSYDLGCAAVVSDWDSGIFEVPFDGKWYAIDGEIFSCEIDNSNSYYNVCWMPVMIEGETDLSLLSLFIMKDNPSVAFLGRAYDIDYSGVASRSFMLDENIGFKTVLIEENNYGANYEYYTYKLNEKVIVPTIQELDGVTGPAVNIQEIDLANSTDAVYEIQGRAWDLKSELFYTNTMELFLSKDISVFSIAPIEPQIFTGSPVTPKIGMRYLDNDILLTSVFQVSYENNIDKGTAKVIVKIDEEDIKGEIVSEFEIKDVADIYPSASEDAWYFDDLVYMQSIGAAPSSKILENALTRAEFVDMLYNYYSPSGAREDLIFTDVGEDSPYLSAIKWAKSAGVIQGVTDKTFAPDKKITRLEMVVMLQRFDEERGNLLSSDAPEVHLADCDEVPLWGKDAVHWAVANGVLAGNDGYILPEDYVTVSEALAMISRCEIRAD